MELILFILKIILIAFLVVLGLVVLALATILFVPIRYEVSGSIGDSWEIQVNGKVSYLLSIIKILFSYKKEQFDVKFFLFGFEKKLQQEDTDKNVDETGDEDLETFSEAEDLEITLHEKESGSVSEQQSVNSVEPSEEYVEKVALEAPSQRKSQKKKEKNSI